MKPTRPIRVAVLSEASTQAIPKDPMKLVKACLSVMAGLSPKVESSVPLSETGLGCATRRHLPMNLGGARVLSSPDFLGRSSKSGLDGVSPHRSRAQGAIKVRNGLASGKTRRTEAVLNSILALGAVATSFLLTGLPFKA